MPPIINAEITRIEVCALPPGDSMWRHYALTLTREDGDQWRVTDPAGREMNTTGHLDRPAAREHPGWLERHRFDRPTALRLARDNASRISHRGLTAGEYLAGFPGETRPVRQQILAAAKEGLLNAAQAVTGGEPVGRAAEGLRQYLRHAIAAAGDEGERLTRAHCAQAVAEAVHAIAQARGARTGQPGDPRGWARFRTLDELAPPVVARILASAAARITAEVSTPAPEDTPDETRP